MIQIRAMTGQDVEAVSLLLGASWRRTYAHIIGLERTARVSDERHAPQDRARVAPVARPGALGGDQPSLLVEAQRGGRDPAAAGHLADRE